MRLTLDDCTYGASEACVLLSRRLTKSEDCALPAHEGNQIPGLQISGNPELDRARSQGLAELCCSGCRPQTPVGRKW